MGMDAGRRRVTTSGRLQPRRCHRVPTVMEKHGKNLVMESHGKWAKKVMSWKFKKVMEKSWNFSTAYRESRMRNFDNSI